MNVSDSTNVGTNSTVRHLERAGGRVCFEATRSDDGVVQTTFTEVVLCNDLKTREDMSKDGELMCERGYRVNGEGIA